MIKKTITYVHPDTKKPITEDLYFHFTEMEMLRIQAKYNGRLEERIDAIGAGTATQLEILEVFEDFAAKGYGERTADGRFVKNQQITDAFMASEPYSKLVIGFFKGEEGAREASEFLNSLMPDELIARAKARQEAEEAAAKAQDSDQVSPERMAQLQERLSRPVQEGEVRGEGIGG